VALGAALLLACDPGSAPVEPATTPAAVGAAAPTSGGLTVEGRAACAPGTGVEGQKAVLIAIAEDQFAGATAHDSERRRLHYDPEARDHRRGGILIVVEFNGDEVETVAEKKEALDRKMRDAYEALYTAGCDDLTWVDLTAHMKAVAFSVDGAGPAGEHPVVFETRLKREDAGTTDWENMETLDFNEM
jgi:hypothetical protein